MHDRWHIIIVIDVAVMKFNFYGLRRFIVANGQKCSGVYELSIHVVTSPLDAVKLASACGQNVMQ